MRQMIKSTLLSLMCIVAVLQTKAQATDLVVDCQTPGWLSSKIEYGDQLTVKNLKVTGYINKTDLVFIGSLTNKELVVVDMGDVTLIEGSWDGLFPGYTYHLQKLIIPKNLVSYCEDSNINNNEVDTLVYESTSTSIKNSFWRQIGHLILGENVDSVNCQLGIFNNIRSVYLPASLKYIATKGFYLLISDLSNTNISEFPSLEYLGHLAFVNDEGVSPPVPNNQRTLPDTIRFPKIREYNISAFDYKEGMHIYLGDSIKNLCYQPDIRNGQFLYWQPTLKNVSFHLKTPTPPSLSLVRAPSSPNYILPFGLTLYIPKGYKEAYEKYLNLFSSATPHYYTLIEEDVPLEQIILSPKELTMDIGEKSTIEAKLLPESATERTIVWSVENANVASVSLSGEVTALSSGETLVYASSTDGKIQDTCKLVVRTHAESITIEPSTVVLSNKGERKQLIATILPDNAVDKSVTWNSSNEQICTVSSEGLVTATGEGTALVTAAAVDGGHTATCTVKVTRHVTNLSLEKHSLSMIVGDSELMFATINPINADNKAVGWSSSNENVASVDADGNVKALKAGEAWIKAISVDNPVAMDSCKVTVIQPVTGIVLSEDSHTFEQAGESVQLIASVQPEDASNKEVRWSSSNGNVCIVQNGLVTATAAGTAFVTVMTVDGNYTANCIIKVVQHVTKVEVNKSALSLKVGSEERLTASVSPDNAENKILAWSSSNGQVASVDANGNVKALKAGEVWVKVVSMDNAEAKDSCKIIVLQPVTGISLSQSNVRLTNIGDNAEIEATVSPADASNKEVKWSSTNETVCLVANGKVIATGFGTAVVIATTIDGGFMASCTVVVEKDVVPVTSIELSQTSATIKKGEMLQLTATVKPEDATNKNVIWKSSDESVCAITQTGLVIGINDGKAYISVVPENGTAQAKCEVTVSAEPDAITEIVYDGQQMAAPVYDMMGRKVKSLVKGQLYICNGKKFIVNLNSATL